MLVVINATLTSTIVVTVAVLNVTAAGYVIISRRSFKMIIIIIILKKKQQQFLKRDFTVQKLVYMSPGVPHLIFLFSIFYCYSQKCMCNMDFCDMQEKKS